MPAIEKLVPTKTKSRMEKETFHFRPEGCAFCASIIVVVITLFRERVRVGDFSFHFIDNRTH